jgi:RNA polymerase sigma-70 factor, ECF subfamily
MTEPTEERLERLLAQLKGGDDAALAPLVALLHDELMALAGALARGRDDTLRPTALVHEVFLRFARAKQRDWVDRQHLLAISARAMRQVLADHARRQGSLKRGGLSRRVTLDDDLSELPPDGVDALDLHAALEDLEKLDSRQARIVELRYLGGMTTLEVAERLGLPLRTVELDSAMARAYLRRRLGTP